MPPLTRRGEIGEPLAIVSRLLSGRQNWNAAVSLAASKFLFDSGLNRFADRLSAGLIHSGGLEARIQPAGDPLFNGTLHQVLRFTLDGFGQK
jgi:hypothetical protein